MFQRFFHELQNACFVFDGTPCMKIPKIFPLTQLRRLCNEMRVTIMNGNFIYTYFIYIFRTTNQVPSDRKGTVRYSV